jgi:hypothetical protein
MSSKNNRLNRPILIHRQRSSPATGAVLKRLLAGPRQFRLANGRVQKAVKGA